MKYILEEYTINAYNAGSKAREDATKIVLNNGYHSIGINDKRSTHKETKLNKALLLIKLFVSMFFKLKKGDVLFMQQSWTVMKVIFLLKKVIEFKIIYLIHDVYSIKYDDKQAHQQEIDYEMGILSKCDFVIAHNQYMIDRLTAYGCNTKLINLKIFDYLTDVSFKRREFSEVPSISFAGDMKKSTFLKELDNIPNDVLKIYAYGNPAMDFENIDYEGKVDAAILPRVIEGNFGLIWEGEYILDEKDNYTRFNNPHKASLYINSGLPLVVWDRSAIANFVRDEGIGICISSLDEIADCLRRISAEEYDHMTKNCECLSSKLKAGYYLSTAISKIY